MLVFGFRIIGAFYFIVKGSSLWILLAFPPLALLYYMISSYYRAWTRELQRLDSVSKSPIYASFTKALNGASTIQVTTGPRKLVQAECTRR